MHDIIINYPFTAAFGTTLCSSSPLTMEGFLSQEVITGLCADRRKLSGREEYEEWHLSMGQCWRKQAWKVKNCFTPRTGIPHWSTSQVRRREGGVRGGGFCPSANVKENRRQKKGCRVVLHSTDWYSTLINCGNSLANISVQVRKVI